MDIREYIDEQEMRNSFNQKILDSIIDDNNDEFSKLISQKNIYNSIINQSFWMSNYKIPDILHGSPTYASLCAFFGSEKCFQALLTVIPEGIESNQLTKRDAYGRTPFHFACAGGNMSIIRELHTAGFRIDQHDFDGKSPCHFSAITGKIDALKYLWSKGVDILSCTDRDFYTPLQMACLYGNVEIVKFICEEVCTDLEELEMNIDRLEFDYRCRFGCSPTKTGNLLHLACQNGNSVVLNYLLSNQKMVVLNVLNCW